MLIRKWFDREWVLSSFGRDEKVAIKNYVQFVANGVQQPSPWLKLKNQIYLGSDNFVENIQMNILRKNLSEIPKIQKRSTPKSLKVYEKALVEEMGLLLSHIEVADIL